jgi:hypothetical protein
MRRFLTSNFLIFLIPVLVTGCYEKTSDDPSKCYKLWSGTNPPKEVTLLKGKYWQSAHWTKEYKLYLILKPSTLWWNELIKQNSLKEDNLDWKVPSDAPSWFESHQKTVANGKVMIILLNQDS